MNKILGILIVSLVLMGTAFGAVNVTANVGNEAPVISESSILFCDGTCGSAKSVDPATNLTVSVEITDPNRQADINVSTLELRLRTGGSPDSWDAVTLLPVSTGTRDGCVQDGNVYCMQVNSGDWTTKFKSGVATIFIDVSDNSAEPAIQATNSSGLTVNATVGHSEDATSGTYSANAGTTNNAILAYTANAYIETTHTGNVDINVSVTATALDDSVHTPIAVGSQKWALGNDSGSSVPFTGGADKVIANMPRGTDPTSATQKLYFWLDIPALQPAGAYLGTLTYNSKAS